MRNFDKKISDACYEVISIILSKYRETIKIFKEMLK